MLSFLGKRPKIAKIEKKIKWNVPSKLIVKLEKKSANFSKFLFFGNNKTYSSKSNFCPWFQQLLENLFSPAEIKIVHKRNFWSDLIK